MADTRITALTALTGDVVATGDLLPIVDISDTTMAASGTTKNITAAELLVYLQNNGLYRHAFKTADQSNNSATTLADVTDLVFPVVAQGIYAFEFNLFAVAAATTTGLVIAMNGPGSPDHLRYAYDAPTSGTAEFNAGATAYETALVSTGVKSTTEPCVHRIVGFLDNGATAGNLQLRMRSEVASSNATIQRGSWGRIVRLG